LREERKLRVSEHRVLRRIFGPTRDGLTGEWRKLDNEELIDLHSIPNSIRVNKSRRNRWARNLAGMMERITWCLGGERDQMEDPSVNGRLIH